MLFKELYDSKDNRFSDLEITGVTCDSRNVKPGNVFVCINGPLNDGHKFAKNAIDSGAVIIICERDLGFDNQIIVKKSREVYAKMCAVWFGHPTEKLKIIGVTGTNGKTSVTYMLKKILEANGHKVGLVGTIQNMIGDTVIPAKNTTPSCYELNSLFSLMATEGCSYAIMEVSSHALDQERVFGINFDVAIFTNLTQDHLDYHLTMENYLAAKKKLFYMCKTAVINSDDQYSAEMMRGIPPKIVTYSTGNDSDYSAKAINYRPAAVEYELVGDSLIQHIKVKTCGKFSVYNSMAAIIAAKELGFSVLSSANALAELEGVKGRAELVPTGRDFSVIIDYAHTPDGLKNILSSFRDYPKNRLIAVFGCGGDRDKTKRPIMGKVAVYNADYVIVTSDNPRTEDPTAIIEDILVGTEGTNKPVKVIENRIEAIEYAISIAQKDDIIVLAGKGHETYQVLSTGTIHLDEREVVRDALAKLS
ncbi:MAG: UDP-N-acetylmuramoyl-L-alanyl-D-glutamate--2,6-diaminopimelate ligase [Oscillospiraceae bacterium]|nr:UDP-N-acetylmuramoyl-L-alanyl-D-glutamate--2,6-diaminopimelate ligase [Oscillospiraceae bacterium]